MAIAYSVSDSFVSVLSWDSVVGAKNLDEIKEWFARQDPYVVIEYGPNKFRTRTDTGLVLYFSVSIHAPLRASPAMLSMWPCTLKLDEEKSKHAHFALQNGFAPAFLH
jgi:hypothetical protein